MDNIFIQSHQAEFEKVMEHLRHEVGGLRTGRASVSMVDGVHVEAYGSRMQLNAVASINVTDSKTIAIEPWDKSQVKAIEKAIIDSGLGFSPNVAGTTIRIILPPMTEENRRNLVKILGEKLEDARKSIRTVRDDIRTEVIAAEREKEISEDEKFMTLDQVDKIAAGFNDRIRHIGDEKEKEIMTV